MFDGGCPSQSLHMLSHASWADDHVPNTVPKSNNSIRTKYAYNLILLYMVAVSHHPYHLGAHWAYPVLFHTTIWEYLGSRYFSLIITDIFMTIKTTHPEKTSITIFTALVSWGPGLEMYDVVQFVCSI